MSALFTPLTLRGVRFRNRVFLSPMCQYQGHLGLAGDWHLVHLGARAAGGVGLVLTEATAVLPDGMISPWDLGLWNEDQEDRFTRITAFLKSHGAVPGIQLGHAGRKASTDLPWRGGRPLPPGEGGWCVVGASPVPFGPEYSEPEELSEPGLHRIRDAFAEAAARAARAGFEVMELHMAHGYLLHSFLSPLSNWREDAYGGSLENRMRFPLEVAEAVRREWPQDFPLFVRVSATDWVDGGWDLPQTVALARRLKDKGVDLIDCSSGGLVPEAKIPVGPGFQVPFAHEIRHQCSMATGAVGMITEPAQAEAILIEGHADAVLIGRELLRQPFWPLAAARALGVEGPWPLSYLRAR